ncbi:Phage tail protein gpX [Clostridium neonatale]|nr:Phage tail protein gpX [Clostridium neonatale]CAI4139224.1 Phage tail protein gpX [Clostridium neonatale]
MKKYNERGRVCHLDNKYYITKDGDTFDILALKFYNNENYAVEIMKANPNQIKNIVFDEGVQLLIPNIEIKEESTLPPWKK